MANTEEIRRVYIRDLPVETYDRLRQDAEEQERSIVWIVKRILRDHYNALDEPPR